MIKQKSKHFCWASLLTDTDAICKDDIDAMSTRQFKNIMAKTKYHDLHISGRPTKLKSHFTRTEINELRNNLLSNIGI